MTIRISKWTALPAALLLFGTVALAQTQAPAPSSPMPDPTVGQRRENQQDRMAQGIKSGQLSAGETAKLENQQKGINQQVKADRAANGGKLTAGEKAQVNKEQNQQSKNIYNKKHNARTQPGTKPAPKK